MYNFEIIIKNNVYYKKILTEINKKVNNLKRNIILIYYHYV